MKMKRSWLETEAGFKMKIKWAFLFTIWLLIMAMPSVVFSWSSDTSVNTPIAVAAYDQDSAVVVDDGAGGAIVAWTDYRNGDIDRDIYAQRVDATGAALWTENGVPICTAIGHQYDINIIGDGTGGAIIAWLDRRSGSSQIFAQRLDANGNVQWASDGILTAANSSSTIVSDGAGGAILAWTDTANDIYAQRINAAGAVQWTSGNLNSAAAYLPVITSDGSGGAIVAWTSGTDDVYAQRIDTNGSISWTSGGVPVAAESLNERAVNIDADGAGGAVILLSIYQSGYQYHVQKIAADGVLAWSTPLWLTNGSSNNIFYHFITDGLGGALISWRDYRTDPNPPDWQNDEAIYVQGMDSGGNLRWPSDGLLVGHRSYQSSSDTVPLISDNTGGFIATWHMSDSNWSGNIYAQHFNAAGVPLWGTDPVPVCTNSANQVNPVATGDGAGGAIIVWPDSRNGSDQDDLYAHRISDAGGSSGLQAPSNVSPAGGVRVDVPPTLSASAFVDDAGQLSHAASQWRVNDINTVTPETPEHDISGDDGYFTYQLPFSFPFFERTITSISVNTNGLIELLEDGETNYANDRYGTHGDGEHINNMDAIFAANDDLDLVNGHLRLYNAGTGVVIEWYGATYLDADADPNYPNVTNSMLFQVVLHQDGRIVWNFSQLDYTLFDYDLYSGVYPNGGVEIGIIEGTLADVTAPATFEFNPATRDISPATYAWFEPQPVMYDSGEVTELVSHNVPNTVVLDDGVTYYWGVRYMGDNNEWSLWSMPTSFVADALPPMVELPTVPEDSAVDVAGNTVIRATFSEVMDAGSIDASSFTLTGPAGSVPGTVGYDTLTASFTPADDLLPDTTYTAALTTAVTDTVGKQMESPYTWSFTTGAEADLTPPFIEEVIPGVDAPDVAIDIGSIRITFNEPMNASTINQNSFMLSGPGGPVAGILSYNAITRTASIDPDELLAFGTTYTVTVTTDIKDNAGNSLAADSWTFTTADEPPPPPLADTVPPRVVSATPSELVPASIPAVTVTFSEPIQHIDTTSFIVSSSGGAVPGTVEYDAAAMTAWFYPTTTLAFNTQYTVRISSTLIRDLADNTMLQDYVGFFSTLGDPAAAGCDPDGGNESGCDSFDYFNYGTGIQLNTYGSSITGYTAEYAARGSVSYGTPLTQSSTGSSAYESQAEARVDNTGFSLRSRSKRMEPSQDLAGAWSMAASKIEVNGVPPGTVIPMSIVVSGNFTGQGGTLLLQVKDFDNYRSLGSATVVGSGSSVTYTQMINIYGDKNDAANYVKSTGSASNGFRLDFLYPANPNNGIYVWFVAGSGNNESTFSTETDFTANLEVNPPPGVTVTLASGQVFNGPVDTDGDGVADLEENSSLNNATIASPAAITGVGNITVDASANAGVTLSQVKVLDDNDLSLLQDGKPTDQNFPDGLVSFRLNGLAPGATATVDLTFPTAFPSNPSYYKVDDLGFYEYFEAVFIGSYTVRLTLTDGGDGDRDGLANGVLDDPGGLAVPNSTVRESGGNGVCFIGTISSKF